MTLPVTPSSEVLVRVEGVSKKFCRSLKKSLWYGLCDIGAELNPFRRPNAEASIIRKESSVPPNNHSPITNNPPPSALREGEFYAVQDVSFELRRGECLGLIGHNGAGKTTLLKMLNGLIKPDAGRVTMRGRVGALIALGAGFNPILTGRENIYINGSILGLSKREIDEKIEEIIEFSEIGDFIDAPVQNYSSGMQVRLGFAVASSLSPDVLILDEVLAVGDIGFVIKCLNRVRKLTANAAVILVTHQMQFVSTFCTRVVLMERGSSILDAECPGVVIDRYYEMIASDTNISGTGEARVHSAILDRGEVVPQGQKAELSVDFEMDPSCESAILHIYVMDQAMSPVVCLPVMTEAGELKSFTSGRHVVHAPLGVIELASGKYSVTVSVADKYTQRSLIRVQGICPFRVYADQSHWGRIVRPSVAVPAEDR